MWSYLVHTYNPPFYHFLRRAYARLDTLTALKEPTFVFCRQLPRTMHTTASVTSQMLFMATNGDQHLQELALALEDPALEPDDLAVHQVALEVPLLLSTP